MSYSLYLWQQLFFTGPARLRLEVVAPLQDWPWNVFGLFACAAASHFLLERPLIALGRVLAGRRRTTAEPHVEAFRATFGRRRGVTRGRPAPAVTEGRR
jgi:peptidoglycan/LPS O-acetylase OafA/YrhL